MIDLLAKVDFSTDMVARTDPPVKCQERSRALSGMTLDSNGVAQH
jgi:hypothetical protein